MVVVDTCVLIAGERGQFDFAAARSSIGDSLALSVITVSELWQGAIRANSPKLRISREALINEYLETMTVLDVDLEVARIHSALWADLLARGMLIGAHDMLIAATALRHGARLATRDRRSFPKIKGLEILEW